MKLLSILIFFFFCSNSFAQDNFNTLNFQPEDEFSHMKIVQQTPDTTKEEIKPKKTPRRKRVKNSDLNYKIDSLNVIYNNIAERNDSILYYLKANLTKPKNIAVPEPEDNTLPLKKLTHIKNTLSNFHFPLKNELIITSNFGIRFHPVHRSDKMHNGVDFRAYFENVYSILDGVVTQSGYTSQNGYYIAVSHANNFESYYLHLSHVYYNVGELVNAGFVIGRSGNTGTSTAPHLHFAVKSNGTFIDPVNFLNNIIDINNVIANLYEK